MKSTKVETHKKLEKSGWKADGYGTYKRYNQKATATKGGFILTTYTPTTGRFLDSNPVQLKDLLK